MDEFPAEVLEQIFAHSPMLDLTNIHSRVCKKWYDIIRRPLFIPWKKSYYRYKLKFADLPNLKAREKKQEGPSSSKKLKYEYEDDEDSDECNDLDLKLEKLARQKEEAFANDQINAKLHLYPPLPKNGKKDIETKCDEKMRLETCGPWLVNFIANEFEAENKKGSFQLIHNHPKFSWAEEWLKERMPELKEKTEVASIAVISCIANDTWDVYDIFRVLSRSSLKSCPCLAISEVRFNNAICMDFDV